MAKRKIRHQPRYPGGRIPTPSSLLPEIREALEAEARRFNVSKSWVNAVALADFFRIRGQASYMIQEKPKLRRVK